MKYRLLKISFTAGMTLFITLNIASYFSLWVSLSAILFIPGMVYFFNKLYDKVIK